MQTLTFVFAFVVVLALIGAAAWLVRRFAGNRHEIVEEVSEIA